jgi:hypothetical protein
MSKYGDVFMWDWKEQPPIGLIVKSAARRKGKLYGVDMGMSDTYTVVIAKNKKDALKAYLEWNKNEFSEEDYKYFLEDIDSIEIELWRDNY